MNKLVILLLVFFSANLFAENNKQDGYTLLKDIKSCERNVSYNCAYSDGYISAVSDALVSVGNLCAKNVRYGQYYEVVKKFLEENPARQNEDRLSLIIEALQKAWPCTTKPYSTGQ